jgi:hypothetical protein
MKRRWTNKEDQYMWDNCQSMCNKDLAIALNRNLAAISNRICILKLGHTLKTSFKQVPTCCKHPKPDPPESLEPVSELSTGMKSIPPEAYVSAEAKRYVDWFKRNKGTDAKPVYNSAAKLEGKHDGHLG